MSNKFKSLTNQSSEKKIHYKDLDGFIRIEYDDLIFFNEYGYMPFFMEREFPMGIKAVWHPSDRFIRIQKINSDGDLLREKIIHDITQFISWAELLSD